MESKSRVGEGHCLADSRRRQKDRSVGRVRALGGAWHDRAVAVAKQWARTKLDPR